MFSLDRRESSCRSCSAYTGTVTALDAREVWDNLSRVHAEQLRQLDSLRSRENNHFTLPLTDQYIKDTFTDCAEQVRSGESVVILNATHAYKRPLGTRATHRLLALERTRLVLETYTAGAFPLVPRMRSPFFEFKRYTPPVTVQEIRLHNCKHGFVKAVITREGLPTSMFVSKTDAGMTHSVLCS